MGWHVHFEEKSFIVEKLSENRALRATKFYGSGASACVTRVNVRRG